MSEVLDPVGTPPEILARGVLLAHAGATLFLTGVIWIVQVVHYPLFARVGVDGFAAYEGDHARLITWVVGPAMVLELVTAGLLLARRPDALPVWSVGLGLALVLALWLSTALVQVPLHQRLTGGFDPGAHAALVATNWLRTVLWTGRSALVLWMLWRLLAPATGEAGAGAAISS